MNLYPCLTSAVLAAALFGMNASAQPAQETQQVETEPATGEPAMWRVTDEDSEFFLFGTFHFLKPDTIWRGSALDEAWKKAETVYFEVEADAPANQSIALNTVMTKGFNPAGKMLTDILAEDDAKKLREVTRKLGLPIAGVDPMRPWNAFLTLSVQFITSKGFEPGAGADSVLLAEARTLGKELAFFETLEQQLALFTDLDPETEKELLVVTLRDWDEQEAAFDQLFNAWLTGNVDFVDEQMNDVMREQAPTVHQSVMVERNLAWAETLDEALRNGAGTAFIAVGAGHLVGNETSVPALLAAKGYEVSRYGVGPAANDNEPER